MNEIFSIILKKLKSFWQSYDSMNRANVTKTLEWEMNEMENIFALILFGFLIGLPSAPMHVTLDLLPYMKDEIDTLLERVDTANEPISELFSLLDIG